MGKSLDDLRAEASALQGTQPKSPHQKPSSKSASPELEDWESQIAEIEKAKKP